MKIRLAFFFLLAGFSSASAQPYGFSQMTSAYSDLAGATTVTTSAPWSYASSFTVPIGFTFNFMGVNYTTVYVEGSGFTYFDFNYYYLLLPYGVKLQSKGSSGNNSPIAYKLDGVAPNRTLKIEWKNAGFYFDTTQTTQFQLWLYETSNKIEVRIGPNNVTNAALVFQENGTDGPVTGIYEYTSFTNCSYGLALSGSPSAAAANMLSGNINLFSTSLNAPPANGAVYVFDPAASSVNENEDHFSLEIFPSPADAHTIIQVRNSEENLSYSLSDLAGKIVVSGICSGEKTMIRTQELGAGMYMLTVGNEEMRRQKKLLVAH